MLVLVPVEETACRFGRGKQGTILCHPPASVGQSVWRVTCVTLDGDKHIYNLTNIAVPLQAQQLTGFRISSDSRKIIKARESTQYDSEAKTQNKNKSIFLHLPTSPTMSTPNRSLPGWGEPQRSSHSSASRIAPQSAPPPSSSQQVSSMPFLACVANISSSLIARQQMLRHTRRSRR